MSVCGVGVLITGESGSGKSECALELVARGHILVADDAVLVERHGNELFGNSPPDLFGLIEVRGIGIYDVRELYGNGSVVERCSVQVVVELRADKMPDERDRLSGVQDKIEIAGLKVPYFVIENSSIRGLPVIVETAARIIKTGGNKAESNLVERYKKVLAD